MQVGFREARYFLVTCSAFVNYLALCHLEMKTSQDAAKAEPTPKPKAGPKAKAKAASKREPKNPAQKKR